MGVNATGFERVVGEGVGKAKEAEIVVGTAGAEVACESFVGAGAVGS